MLLGDFYKKGGEIIKMTNFDWYKPETGKSYMSIGKCRIGISKKLFDDMDKPKYIQLGYFDKTMSIIIKLCNKNSEYRIEVKSGKYPPKINNRGFIEFLISKGFKIENKAKRYMAVWNEVEKVGYIK